MSETIGIMEVDTVNKATLAWLGGYYKVNGVRAQVAMSIWLGNKVTLEKSVQALFDMEMA